MDTRKTIPLFGLLYQYCFQKGASRHTCCICILLNETKRDTFHECKTNMSGGCQENFFFLNINIKNHKKRKESGMRAKVEICTCSSASRGGGRGAFGGQCQNMTSDEGKRQKA